MLKLRSCYVARVFLSHLFIIPFFFDFKQVLRTRLRGPFQSGADAVYARCPPPPPVRPETILSHPRPPSTQLSRHWSPPADSAERLLRGLQIQRCAALCTCRTSFFCGDIAVSALSTSVYGQRAAVGTACMLRLYRRIDSAFSVPLFPVGECLIFPSFFSIIRKSLPFLCGKNLEKREF